MTDNSATDSTELERAQYCLQQLTLLLKDHTDLNDFPIYDEDFLLRFVRAKKYNAEVAYKTIINYCNVRRKHSNIFQCAYPSYGQVKYLIDSNVVTKLKFRNKDGREVFVVDVDLWDPNEVSMDLLMSVMILLVEESLNVSVDAQVNGIACLMHLQNFSFSHFKQVSLSRLKFMISVWRGTIPMRLKNIYMIRQPTLISYVVKMASPFLTKKIRSRLYFIGDDTVALDKEIPLKHLPIKFGGELSNDKAFDEEFKKQLYEKDSYYKLFWNC